MAMESLYTKLYDKYARLKTTKFSEIEESGRNQEEKFKNYVDLAEELIERLRSENERLQTRVDELNEEVRSIRSSSDEYQKLWSEECEKTQELSKEVERLQALQEHLHSKERDIDNVRTRKRSIDSVHWDSSGGTQADPEITPTNSLRKKPHLQVAVVQPYQANQLNIPMSTNSERNSYGGTAFDDDQGLQLANNSSARPANSGDNMSADSMFKALMESLVGLKFSFVNEPEQICLSAVHSSSGYSFSLTWMSLAAKEVELVYQVTSLGTIERLATEWMKEEIRFGVSMFPLFMKRLSKVLGHQL